MFLPNISVLVYARTDTQDVFANYTYEAPFSALCALTALDLKVVKTSIRADSSASRGRAEEEAGVSRFLFAKDAVLKLGDIISFEGEWLEVIEIFPRRDILGKVDHLQVYVRKGVSPV